VSWPVEHVRAVLDIGAADTGDLCIYCGVCRAALMEHGGQITGAALDSMVEAHAAICEGPARRMLGPRAPRPLPHLGPTPRAVPIPNAVMGQGGVRSCGTGNEGTRA
jgi:hypothetical protein